MMRNLLKRAEGNIITSYIKENQLSTVFSQIVRWRRKPRWLPTAKSKVFRVNERKRIPVEELKEIIKLYNNYRTEMKSIRYFFTNQNKELSDKTEGLPEENEEEELKRSIQLNEEWNNEIRKLREEILAKEKEAEMEEILKHVETNEIELAARKRKVDEIVKEEKERAKTYITLENIDDAIDRILEDHIDYNFAIDTEGNFYHGRNVKPSKAQTEDKQISEVKIASA